MVGYYLVTKAKVIIQYIDINISNFIIGYHLHNHDCTKIENTYVHPSAQRMTPAQYKIVGQQMEARISPTKTYKFLINAYSNMKVVQKDIYNAQKQIKHQKLKGRT
jgi:hypothetical protein